ncbi:HD domain-containing phosphohydrolase [Singulisphaera sp. Ch08]|uniref:HD domain-containing phosphohydrolase n=1 Tax=Singulisphaera sp. Ch08 TaxID=3120278 RepID=A0AAU7CF51_9BACT
MIKQQTDRDPVLATATTEWPMAGACRPVRRADRHSGAERMSWETEKISRAVLDSLSAHVAVLDGSGALLAVNRAWRDFAGANAPAGVRIAKGANYLRVCDEATGEDAETARAFAAAIRDVLAGRRAEFAREYPCRALGQQRWFIGRVTRLAGSGPVRVVVAHEEVTERKRMEEALGRSESRLQAVLDHVQAAIFLKDVDGRYLLVNRYFVKQFGVTEEQVVGKTDYDFLPEDVADTFRANDRRALDAGEPVEVDEVAPYVDKPHTSIVIKVPLLGADQKPIAVCGIATDITDRKKAEAALSESEAVLRSFYDGAPMALAVAEECGGDLRIVSANSAFARLLEHSPEGRQAGEPEIPEEQRRRWLDAFREARCSGRPACVEDAWKTTDGPRWFAVLVNPIAYEPEGRPRFCVMVEDITERKRAEREIFVLNVELEARLGRIQSLRQIDMAITGSLDLPLMLGVVIDQVRTHLKVDAAGILLCSPLMPRLEYAVRKGYRGGTAGGPSQRFDEGPAGRAVLERRTQQLTGPSAMPAPLPDSYREEGLVSYWAVPLVIKGQVKGVLEAGHRSPLEPEPEWLEFLKALAGQAAIAVENAELFEGLRRSNLELSLAYDATIEGWSRAMDLRDHETEGHSRRVTEMTLRLARAMGIGEADLVHVRRGALLHDIGKIGIPDAILLKPGPLTDDEFATIRRHPEYARKMLAPIAFLRPALDIPYYHHEKWDGSGYPRGFDGEQIPLVARIFAAVDIWDALSYDRPYRKVWPREKVHEHLRSLSGTHLDPRVVESFLEILSREAPAP